MKRRIALIALFCFLGILVIVGGPVALRLLTDVPVEYRAIRELARRERYREQYPPERLLIGAEPEVVLRAAASQVVHVYRLDPLPDSACVRIETTECLQGHRIVGKIQVDGRDWAQHLLAEVTRMSTESRQPQSLKPRFGIRFIGTSDTTTVLLDTTDSLRIATLMLHWTDSSGNRRRSFAHMPYSFEGDADADSTLRNLKRIPTRV